MIGRTFVRGANALRAIKNQPPRELGSSEIAPDLDPKQLERILLERERARREALLADDMPSFAALLADDIVHVHATGIVQGKADLLGHAGGFLKFLDIERGPLTIRPIGPAAAVMTGPMTNIVKRRDQDEVVTIKSYVTQVWTRDGDDWRISSFQATRLAEPPA